MSIVLYKYNALDVLMTWSIFSDNDKLIINHGQVNGKLQTKIDFVEINQSGRDIDAQVALQLQSRVSKQIDKGYCTSIEEAMASKNLNANKLFRPMLAKKFKDVKNIDFNNAWLQYKYNGHRCLIANIGDELIAYSRNGKLITSIGHILDFINIPEGTVLDGELYHHGSSLQAISSWIKRSQEDSKKLSYICYDAISDNTYDKRIDFIYKYVGGKPNITVAPSQICHPDLIIAERLNDAIDKGYEGLMLRQNDYGYDAGNRSSSLLKIKKVQDAEYLVIDIVPSKDDWGILECLLPNNTTFRVSAPGTIDNKRHILYHKHQYIGRYITVEYFELTKDGVPFHPVAINWRT